MDKGVLHTQVSTPRTLGRYPTAKKHRTFRHGKNMKLLKQSNRRATWGEEVNVAQGHLQHQIEIAYVLLALGYKILGVR